MDLWVLNQDKTKLEKCNEIYLYLCEEHCLLRSDKSIALGTYDTPEIAQDILIDIANHLYAEDDTIYSMPPREYSPKGDDLKSNLIT